MALYLDAADSVYEAKRLRLISRLKSCGADCTLHMPIHIEGPEYVELGDGVSIAPFVHLWGQGGIRIGNRAMIGSHSAISSLTHDHRSLHMSESLVQLPVTIEDDVWLGTHSVIMPGVTVGCGAVVGAGAVVTVDVAPYSVVAGVPAKHIKNREH
jgi:acetyltransferase-like isoleucine patch superfamily enzyme